MGGGGRRWMEVVMWAEGGWKVSVGMWKLGGAEWKVNGGGGSWVELG